MTNGSEWKKSSLDRRDFRAVKDGPEVTGKPKKKKDTKRWCKGKEGREHVLATKMGKQRFRGTEKCEVSRFPRIFNGYVCYHVVACERCGKVDMEWLPKEMCPDWKP